MAVRWGGTCGRCGAEEDAHWPRQVALQVGPWDQGAGPLLGVN